MPKKVSKGRRLKTSRTAKGGNRATNTKKKRSSTKKRGATAGSSELNSLIRLYQDAHYPTSILPKIPDGKVAKSTGFGVQSVGQISTVNSTNFNTNFQSPNGVMHILVYAGINSGAVVFNSQASGVAVETNGTTTNKSVLGGVRSGYEVLGFENTTDLNFEGAQIGGTSFFEATDDEAAFWRCVSCQLKLGLLNPAETDNGWWEAIHVTEEMDSDKYRILPRDNIIGTDKGTIVPSGYLNALATRDISNVTSYRSGLLRDIGKERFAVAPNFRDHDMIQLQSNYLFSDTEGVDEEQTSPLAVAADGRYVGFNSGRIEAIDFINKHIDPSYDMVYIRIHGRNSGVSTDLHYNLASNQEVIYPTDSKLSLLMTPGAMATRTRWEDAKKAAQNMAVYPQHGT